MAQKQDCEDLSSLVRSVGRNEKQIDQLGQQVSNMMLDLRRGKTKVGMHQSTLGYALVDSGPTIRKKTFL